MTSTTLSPILSLLLVLSMLLSPVGNPMKGEQSAALPHVTISVVDPYEDQYVLGITDATTGVPVAYYTDGYHTVYLTSEAAIIDSSAVSTGTRQADGSLRLTPGQVITVPMSELMSYVAMASGQLPQPTEDDVMAVACLLSGMMQSVSPEALSIVPRGQGFSFTMDVDRFLADIDKAVPEVLTAYASIIDPTISKYTTALAGVPLSAAQLAQFWPELGLSAVHTGLTLSLMVIPTEDDVTLIGRVVDLSFAGRISEAGLELRFTTPDGVIYPLDTADLAVLANPLGELAAQVITESFSYVSTTDGATFTIFVDTPALAASLNDGLARILNANAAHVDALLEKYRPWLLLLSPALADTSATELASLIKTRQPISLPQVNGQIVANMTRLGYSLDGTLVGPFGTLTITGDMQMPNSAYADTPFTLTVTLNDGRDAYTATMNASAPDNRLHATVDFSKPLFGLFQTLTFTLANDYDDERIVISTDTDAFHFTFSVQEQYMDMKLGPAAFTMRQIGQDWLFGLTLPEFYANAQIGEDFMNLDSSFLGLEVMEHDNATIISGYIRDEYSRNDFSLSIQENNGYIGGSIDGYLIGDDANIACTITSDGLKLVVDGELYSIVPDSDTDAILFCHNHTIKATLHGEVDGDVLTMRLYEDYVSNPDTAQPLYTIVLDNASDPITLPANAQTVGAQYFIQTLVDILD